MKNLYNIRYKGSSLKYLRRYYRTEELLVSGFLLLECMHNHFRIQRRNSCEVSKRRVVSRRIYAKVIHNTHWWGYYSVSRQCQCR